MDKKDLEILDLFTRYSGWLKNNNLKDTIDNYRNYFVDIEKVQFTYGRITNIFDKTNAKYSETSLS